MSEEIPSIPFKKDSELYLEVIDLKVFYKKLKDVIDHDPFSIHRIEFYMILMVKKNSFSHFLDFEVYDLKAGSALFVAKGQVQHFFENLEDTEGYCIIFNSDFLNKHFFLHSGKKFNRLFNYHIESPVLHPDELGENTFFDIAHRLFEEYKAPEPFAKSEILGSLLNILLIKAERAKEFRSGLKINPRWLETFTEFKNLLEENHAETRSSRFYANSMHISYKYLNDVVKKVSGNSVKRFIDIYVIIEIKRYLITTSYSVKEISHMVGFDEPGNMIKFFKKNTGVTPLKFRQHQK